MISIGLGLAGSLLYDYIRVAEDKKVKAIYTYAGR